MTRDGNDALIVDPKRIKVLTTAATNIQDQFRILIDKPNFASCTAACLEDSPALPCSVSLAVPQFLSTLRLMFCFLEEVKVGERNQGGAP